jgi:hypothetical protein
VRSRCSTPNRAECGRGPFLKEERRLINAIAERLAFFLLQQRLAPPSGLEGAREMSSEEHPDWKVILNFIAKTDPRLLERVSVR